MAYCSNINDIAGHLAESNKQNVLKDLNIRSYCKHWKMFLRIVIRCLNKTSLKRKIERTFKYYSQSKSYRLSS